MRAFASRILIFCLFFALSSSLFAHVALDYPQGGESFTAGQVVYIEWHIVIPHDTQNWDLYISSDAGENWSPLILNLPVDQFSYMWNVPYVNTDQARIRVVQDNIMDIDYMDESSNFTIVVPPQDGPVFEMPAQDITIECNENTQSILEQWLEEYGGAIAVGTCGDLVWTNDFVSLSDSCGATGSALVTFTVSDDCGINHTTAWVTVVDSTAPVIEVPATAITVECDGSGNLVELTAWVNDHGGAMASDACSDIGWTIDGEFIVFSLECGPTGNTLVTFIASDACGNTSTTNARFTIEDTTPPVLIAPARDTIIQCTGDSVALLVEGWLNLHGNALAVDVCDSVEWSHDLTEYPVECDEDFSKTVRFTARDHCGNITLTEAKVTLEGSTGLSESGTKNINLEIFPNPADQEITILFESDEPVNRSLSLYDAPGRQCWSYTGSAKQLSVPVQDLSSGIYILHVKADKTKVVRTVFVR